MKVGKTLSILVACGLVAASVAAAGPIAAQETPVLEPLRTVGGPGHAGLYGWGAATMSDGTVLIGDYWNYRVQHYDTDGTLLRTAVPADGNHQAPFDVAVDQRDDSIYIADTDGGRNIDKYDKNGNYLFSFGSQQIHKYPSWLDVDASGRVAVADGVDNKIVVYNDSGTVLFTFGGAGGNPGSFKQPRGVGFDAVGNLYVADVGNNRIQVFTLSDTQATFLRQWSVPGDFRGLTVDQQQGWVYLVNTALGLVQKFDLNGAPLAEFGGWGTGPGLFLDGGRDVTVDGDGNVWVGDMPNFRAQKFSPEGTYLTQAPNPSQPPTPGGFALPGSAALDAAGNIFVVDTYNWRIQKLDSDGAFVTQWGRRGGGVDPYGLNYPRGISVDRSDGSVIVSDTDNSWLKKYSNDGEFIWGLGDVKSFATSVGGDGTIYAADFGADTVKVISADGSLEGTFGATSLDNPRGIDVDPDGSIWVTSRDTGTVSHFTAAGQLVIQFGSKGPGDDQLGTAADIESDGDHVYVADESANRIKVWTKSGVFVGAYGSGGTGLGQLSIPRGLDLHDGSLYVTEMTNERVQEFIIGGQSVVDLEPPETMMTSPESGEVLTSQTVTAVGSATDDVGVAQVRVAVRDRTAGQWWNGTTWAGFTWLQATLANPGAVDTDWTFTWESPGAGDYALLVRAVDTSGRLDESAVWRAFSVAEDGGTVDVMPPAHTIASPSNGATLPLGAAVLSGSATDDVGLAAVEVAVRNPATGQWLHADGQWGGFAWVNATLAAPGSTASSWSFSLEALPAASYGFMARATDTSGNRGTTQPWRGFSIG